MPNKKISQLSGIYPVPTGALMIIANSGVSRNATVKDIANAVSASTSTFSGLTDTPVGISGDMFVVGNSDGTALVFSNDLNLGTGHFLDKRYGGTISGDVTMAAGENLYFSNTSNKISVTGPTSGETLDIKGARRVRISSHSGVMLYNYGSNKENTALWFADGQSEADIKQTIQLIPQGGTDGKFLISGWQTVFNPGIDVSGKIYQSGKEIQTGLYQLKSDPHAFIELSDVPSNELTSVQNHIIRVSAIGDSLEYYDTGHFVGADETGSFVVNHETGNFVDQDMTGILVNKDETGVFPTGYGKAGYYAKWETSNSLTSGIVTDNTVALYPVSGQVNELGRNAIANRWGDFYGRNYDGIETGILSTVAIKSSNTGQAYSQFQAKNSDNDYLLLGISATGNTQTNIGSGSYYLYGTDTGIMNIGNRHDILVFADATKGITNTNARTIAEFLKTRQINLGSGSGDHIALKGLINADIIPSGDLQFGLGDPNHIFSGAYIEKIMGEPSGAQGGPSGQNSLWLKYDNQGGFTKNVALESNQGVDVFLDSNNDNIATRFGIFDGMSPTGGASDAQSIFLVRANGEVVFNNAFTFPTADGAANTYLKTDGLGNVDWATTSHGVFTGLTDVYTGADGLPQASYGQPGQLVVVNKHSDGLIYSGYAAISGSGGGGGKDNWIDLDDTIPTTFAGNNGKIVRVQDFPQGSTPFGLEFFDSGIFVGENETGNFVDQDMTGILVHKDETGIFLTGLNFTGLNDTPTDYSFASNNFVTVNADGDGLRFFPSGSLTFSSETGDFVDIHMTGDLIDKYMTGNFVDQDMTGNLLASGDNFCAEYNVDMQAAGVVITETHPANSGTAGPRLLKPELSLQKGSTYKFNVTGRSTAQFHFGISTGLAGTHEPESAWTSQLWPSGMDRSTATALDESLMFRVPQQAPEKLYYNVFNTATPTLGTHAVDDLGGTITTYTNTGNFVTAGDISDFISPAYLLTGISFVGLSDTPSNYTVDGGLSSAAGHIVKVNTIGSAMEFFDTGHFVGADETGNFVDQDMTGDFYSKRGGPISGDVQIVGPELDLSSNPNPALPNVTLHVSGDLKIESGVSYHVPYIYGDQAAYINCASGNLQYKTIFGSSVHYDLLEMKDGQTLTLAVSNNGALNRDVFIHSGQPMYSETNSFDDVPDSVLWPMSPDGNRSAPKLGSYQTNLYTLVRINTGIFVSYITGFDYHSA
jgi:hypothetical protein